MPYTSPFVLTTIEGYFGTAPGQEIWRCTFKIPHSAGTTPTSTNLLDWLTNVSTNIQAFHLDATLKSGSNSVLTSLAAANIGVDGKYLGGGAQSTVRYTYPSEWPGQGTRLYPFTTALCVSMKTSRARGRASRGRMYWPAGGTALNAADGLVSVTNQTAITAAAKTMLDGINTKAKTYIGGSSNLSVMSNLGAGTVAPVTHVSIGRRFDHQESRERNFPEGHVWVPLPSAAGLLQEEIERVDQLQAEEAAALLQASQE